MRTLPSYAIGFLSLVCSVSLFGQIAWHFEFEGGVPVKLVWQTQPGQTCNLRSTADLQAWTQVAGFPQVATGATMEHAFVSGACGYFQISLGTAGGGWQQSGLPQLPEGSSYSFSSVFARTPQQLWLAGSVEPSRDVCVLKSGDGGATWTQVYRAAGVGFFGDLQMATAEVGYAAGGGVRRTTDGGVTWEADQGNLPDPPGTWHNVGPDGYVYGLAVVDAGNVWTAGYDGASAGVIYHRVPGRPPVDPGTVNVNTPWWLEWAETARGMYGVSAVNATTAWAVGYAGYIWKTVDGQGWGRQTSPTAVALYDVDAVDATTVWVVGDAGTILKTTDGGTTWTPQVSGTTETLHRVAAVDSEVAWAVGTGGVVLHTADGGTNWIRQLTGTTARLLGVAAVDAQTAWAVGDGNTLLRTTDGGSGKWLAPTLTKVTPSVVGAGSQPPMTVTLTGTGFRSGNLGVTFGTEPGGGPTWINETTVQVAAPPTVPGTWDVTLVNEDGQQATLPRAVTFVPEPVITRYSPWHGPARGGYQIRLDGYNLQTVTNATFYVTGGDSETLPVTVIDSTRAVVTVPESLARLPASVFLVLATAERQTVGVNDFLLDPEGGPTFAVTSVTPDSGTYATSVTVTGVGFTTNTTVELCGSTLAITNRTATSLSGKVLGGFGPGPLSVQNTENDYVSVNPAFVLLGGPVPTLTQVAPSAGSAAGGTTVTLTGTGFTATDLVTLDGYAATVLSQTPTSLVVLVPPHAPGVVSVFVMSDDLERSAAVLPGGFTYQ